MSDSVGEPPGSGKGSSNKTTNQKEAEEDNGGGDVANKSPPTNNNNTNTNTASPPSPSPPPPPPSPPPSSKNDNYTDSKVKKNSPPIAKSADSTASEPPQSAPPPTNKSPPPAPPPSKSSPTPSPGSDSTTPSPPPPPPKVLPGNEAAGSVPVPPPSDDSPPSPPPPKPYPSPPPPKSDPSPPPPPKSSSPSPPPPTPTAINPPSSNDSSEAPPSKSAPSTSDDSPTPPSKSAPSTSNDSPTPPSTPPPPQTTPTPSGSNVPSSSVPPPPNQANSGPSSSPAPPTGDPSSPLSPSPPGEPVINLPPFPNIPFPPPPASRKPHLSPPSHESKTNSTDHDQPSLSSTNVVIIAGASIAGLLIIALVAFFILNSKKKKKNNSQTFPSPQGPLPGNFPMQPDGYYCMQQHPQNQTAAFSDQSDENKKGTTLATEAGPNQGAYRAKTPEPSGLGSAKLSFSYEELMNITNMFSPENVIGEGGFGCVYKGWLQDGRIVAVKELRDGSGQGEREFRAEVEIISRVHHCHLVSLVGYCIAESHRLLVYEFVPNSNLSHHLHGKGMPVLEWPKRVKIAIGAARGLKYLHDDCHPKIIHRDIKSANILLDETYEAQVADFGLAKPRTDSNTHVSTRVMGTFGYMAPEYATSGKLTDKSDVFSFGVVLLELVTGRKPVDPTQPLGDESLVEWKSHNISAPQANLTILHIYAKAIDKFCTHVEGNELETNSMNYVNFMQTSKNLVSNEEHKREEPPLTDRNTVSLFNFYNSGARPFLIDALDTGDFSELADPRLQKRYVEIEMYKMIEAAAACIRHSAQKRPRMVQVLTSLDNESHSSDLTNGVKLGHSTVYESGRYSKDFERLQRMAFADSSEYEMSSGEYTSRELGFARPIPVRPEESHSAELLVSDTESCTQGSERNTDNAHAN